MSTLDQSKPEPLVVRLSPHQKVEDELREQLKLRGIKVSTEVSLRLNSSTRSNLESFLWRDIQYFLFKEYSEYSAIKKALDRLRINPLFIETVEKLTTQFEQEDQQNE